MAYVNEKDYSNREVKSSAFTALFSEPKNAAALYKALEGEEIAPEEIDFTTLSGVLFLARKNDMAFLAKRRVLVISEHQSTINNNMPLRSAIYYGRTMEQLIEPRALYRNKQIGIPTPEFYVFYNGYEDFPDEKILKLSDAYLDKGKKGMLELDVKVINVNLMAAHPLLQKCRPMYEYSYFIDRIKYYISEGLKRDEAIVKGMEECQEKGLLVDFLNRYGKEASNMLFTQFNMEDALEIRGEEKFEEGKTEGRAEGKAEAIIEILKEYGEVVKELETHILKEENMHTLNQWLKLAIRAKSIDEFREDARL